MMALVAGGCLDPIAFTDDPVPGVPDAGAKLDQPGPDAAAPPAVDLGPGAAVDLATLDLTGLTNCYGATVCDPAQQFCVRYHDGSQGAPGALYAGPACFVPNTDCATLGQNMDCGCIQADDSLGAKCQGGCVDNQNGTFDCYAQQ
jgi:hypothetical protein